MATLYEITDEMRALDQWLDDHDGEVPEGEEDALLAYLASLDGALEAKVDAYVALIRENEARASVRNEEAARLRELASIDSKKAGRLKDRLLESLLELDVDRLETERFRVTVANNGGATPVNVDPSIPADSVPVEYRKVSVSIDKRKVRAALESGVELIWASLGERGRHLRVK